MQLNLQWSTIQSLGPHDRKLKFVREWLKPVEIEWKRCEVEQALKHCADELRKQQPEDDLQETAEILASRDFRAPSSSEQKTALSIFNAISTCKECYYPSQHGLKAKLRLRTLWDPQRVAESTKSGNQESHGDDEANEKLVLDMFLSMERDWHDYVIQAVGATQVPFSAIEEVVPPYDGIGERMGKLCESIAIVEGWPSRRLELNLISDQLFCLKTEKKEIQFIKTVTGPISLSDCFGELEFLPDKTKRILSLFIGYAVLHLTGAPWLKSGLRAANLKFFRTNISSIPLRPFIQVQLLRVSTPGSTADGKRAGDDSDDDSILDDFGLDHPYPELVALAVMLMELHFFMPFQEMAKQRDVELDERSEHITANDAYQVYYGLEIDGKIITKGWRSNMAYVLHLRKAIDNCLNEEIWDDAVHDSQMLASKIYTQVVFHLECYLASGYRIPLDEVDKIATDVNLFWGGQALNDKRPDSIANSVRSSATTTTPTQPLPAFPDLKQAEDRLIGPEALLPTGQSSRLSNIVPNCPELKPYVESDSGEHQFFDDEIVDESSLRKGTESYELWKARYKQVYDNFTRTPRTKAPLQPVKVAILDTGIDLDHYVFQTANLKGMRNCYDESQRDVPDHHGHGTFVATLVLDYAPDAELYVIKVVGRENAGPDGEIIANVSSVTSADGSFLTSMGLHTQAINFAVESWDVDIVSMSFGWPSAFFKGSSALRTAIDKAHSKQVLMFAAASNNGGRSGRAYPASRREVFCVHSTDTYGNGSKFSPTAQKHAPNFATVGEAIRSAWPADLCPDKSHPFRINSGTSYATPIMVGIAAFLLHYVRLNLPEQALELKRQDKMEKLLKRCNARGPDDRLRDGYFYIELSLNPQNFFGKGLNVVYNNIHEILTT